MRKKIEPAEIQEPAISEIKKRGSCTKRGCSTSCGCLVFILILIGLFLKFVIFAPKDLKTIPPHFPNEVPIYDKDAIVDITLIKDTDNYRWLRLPRLIVTPIRAVIERRISRTDNEDLTKPLVWQHIMELFSESSADNRDVIYIEWHDLQAEPDYIVEYYSTQLKRHRFVLDAYETSAAINQLRFSKGDIDGIVYIDDSNRAGTDYVSLILHLPAKPTK